MKMRKWAIVAFAASLAALVRANVPVAINFTGCLEEISGSDAEAADGSSVYMAFRLYDDRNSAVTNALWARQAMVTLDDGVFDVELSDTLGTALPGFEDRTLTAAIAKVAAGGSSTFWIGLTPGAPNNAEIEPRQRVDTVVRAVQAQNVRRVADDFTVGERLIVEEGCELVVTGRQGSATFNGRSEYGEVSFGKTPSFDGGFSVGGKLTAGSLQGVKTVEAGVTKAAALDAKGVETPLVALSGEANWTPGSRMVASTARVARVEAPLTLSGNAVSKATLLDAATLETTRGLQETGAWSPIGGLYEVDEKDYVQADVAGGFDSENFSFVHPTSLRTITVQSVYAGSWTAPKDCIAYFETYVHDLNGDGACVQFYVASYSTMRQFQSRTPSGVAICQGAGQTVRTVVPVVLRAGETVQWLGYNKNKLEGQTKVQSNDTRVNKISYRAFGWSEKKEVTK